MVLGRHGSRVPLMCPSPQPPAPFPLVTQACAESQAALGHITLWPLGRDSLRRFPRILLCWGQECEWNLLALILGFAMCPQCLLLAFVPQSSFGQCILIPKSDLKNSVFQNWAIYPNITPYNWTTVTREHYRPIYPWQSCIFQACCLDDNQSRVLLHSKNQS